MDDEILVLNDMGGGNHDCFIQCDRNAPSEHEAS